MPLELIEFPADDLARARGFWEAVLDVSTYSVSTGYSTQSFAQVKYVATTPAGPREHRILFSRLGNLKSDRLAALLEEHRRRMLSGAPAPEGGGVQA